MLTILAMPKPFQGHIATIQRNAITSWTQLRPRPEIFLFGAEPGVAEIAAELGLGYWPEVARNEYGTPLLDDALEKAHRLASHRLLCYVNSDIILLGAFLEAVAAVSRQLEKFLIVAQRLNVDVTAPIAFGAGWEENFRRETMAAGAPGSHTAIDLFVFPQRTFARVPPFAVGRAWFDQWFIKAARESSVPVVDVSRVARAIHQNHDYSHVAGGQEWSYRGVEAQKSLELYSTKPHAYTLLDVTHELVPEGKLKPVRLRRPLFVTRDWLWRIFVRNTAPVRKRLGMRRETWRKVSKKDSVSRA